MQTPKNFYVIMMVKRFRIPNHHKMNLSKRPNYYRGLDLQKPDTGRMFIADPVGFSQEKQKETKKQKIRETKETKGLQTHKKNTQKIDTNLYKATPIAPYCLYHTGFRIKGLQVPR